MRYNSVKKFQRNGRIVKSTAVYIPRTIRVVISCGLDVNSQAPVYVLNIVYNVSGENVTRGCNSTNLRPLNFLHLMFFVNEMRQLTYLKILNFLA